MMGALPRAKAAERGALTLSARVTMACAICASQYHDGYCQDLRSVP